MTRRIMFHNPVGNSGYDAMFAEVLSRYRLPGTEIHVTSLPPEEGAFSHIEYRAYEGRVTSGIIRASRAAAREGFDAFVIGCFYDTGLHDAREVSGDMIVTAPCISACEIASSLANRFGIIVGRRKWVAQMQATVHDYGYGSRLSGFYHVELGVTEFQQDHAKPNAASSPQAAARSKKTMPKLSSSAARSKSASTRNSKTSSASPSSTPPSPRSNVPNTPPP